MTPRIGLILLTALLMQCGNPVETPLPGAETIPARLQETTHFNGGNAMFHAARMTEMGDRGSGTPGYRQQLDYLKKELAFSHGTIEAIQADVRTSDTAEDNLFAKEISLLIEMVVSEMPKQRQLIYRLSKEQGLSNEEIASKLGISKRSVENQISMALKEIKRAISFYLIFLLCMLS